MKLALILACVLITPVLAFPFQDRSGSLTPLQLEIEKQRLRLGSAEVEDRRDAISRLGSMKHPAASRVAVAGLTDSLPIVRATSVTAVLSLAPEESAAHLLPLLNDKDVLVRREAAYGLGITRSATAIPMLLDLLRYDKVDEVRGAAAVALGKIGNDNAVVSLVDVLTGQTEQDKKRKAKPEQNPFVLRSAARALGQIGSRASVPALITTLQNEQSDDDLRREAATALGAIADPSALPALRNVTAARDPHLAMAADAAIKSILKASR